MSRVVRRSGSVIGKDVLMQLSIPGDIGKSSSGLVNLPLGVEGDNKSVQIGSQ